jgi:hypothetical protein
MAGRSIRPGFDAKPVRGKKLYLAGGLIERELASGRPGSKVLWHCTDALF